MNKLIAYMVISPWLLFKWLFWMPVVGVVALIGGTVEWAAAVVYQEKRQQGVSPWWWYVYTVFKGATW